MFFPLVGVSPMTQFVLFTAGSSGGAFEAVYYTVADDSIVEGEQWFVVVATIMDPDVALFDLGADDGHGDVAVFRVFRVLGYADDC